MPSEERRIKFQFYFAVRAVGCLAVRIVSSVKSLQKRFCVVLIRARVLAQDDVNKGPPV